MVNVQRLAIVQLTCSSQIQYQRDAGQRSFKHIIFRTEICRAAASSRACQLSRAGLCVSLRYLPCMVQVGALFGTVGGVPTVLTL